MSTATLERELTVSEVAAAAGVNVSAVRFYEQHGLVTAERTAGNQRRFDRTASCRIKVARVGQRVGLTVAEIRELLRLLPDGAEPATQDWQALHTAILAEAERRMQELRQAMTDIANGEMLCDVPVTGAGLGRRPAARPRSSG